MAHPMQIVASATEGIVQPCQNGRRHSAGAKPMNNAASVTMNIRCCLAIGPLKSLGAPAALAMARMYATKTASIAPRKPRATSE